MFDRVLVVGLGLLGGSFALALQSSGLARQVFGRDANPDHERQALLLGLVSRRWDPQREPEPFDLVFVAVPPSHMESVLVELRAWVHPGTLVTDACSVKAPVARSMQSVFGGHAGLLPAHPIAGWHSSGPGSGRADLFNNKPVILTPLASTSSATLAAGRRMWSTLGARVVEMEAEAHDSLFALISHLPHLLAFSTMNLAADRNADLSLVGSGFRDATRLAQCPALLWADIAIANREAMLPVLGDFIQEVQNLEADLRAGDQGNLTRRFTRARQLRVSMEEPTSAP